MKEVIALNKEKTNNELLAELIELPENEKKQEDILNKNETLKREQLSIYIYNPETTIYQETAHIEKFFEIFIDLIKETNPTCFFIKTEQKYLTKIKNHIILGMKLSKEHTPEERLKEIMKNIEEKQKEDKRLKLSATLYYRDQKNPYKSGKDYEVFIKETNKKDDIFVNFSYNIKHLAKTIGMKGVPQLDNNSTLEEERNLEGNLKIYVTTENIKAKKTC